MTLATVKHGDITVTINFYTGDVEQVAPVPEYHTQYNEYKVICRIFQFNLTEWCRYFQKPLKRSYNIHELGYYYLDHKYKKQYVPPDLDYRDKMKK